MLRWIFAFPVVWPLWTGLFWGLVSIYGWMLGAWIAVMLRNDPDIALSGAIGLGVMQGLVLFSAVIRNARGEEATLPLFAAMTAGAAAVGALAAMGGASRRVVGFASFAGLFVGAFSGVPKVIVTVRPKIAVAALAAFCGWATATVGFVLANFVGWIVAHAVAFGIVGVIDAMAVQSSDDEAAGYRFRESAIAAARGMFAGLLAGAFLIHSAELEGERLKAAGTPAAIAALFHLVGVVQACFAKPRPGRIERTNADPDSSESPAT